MRGRGPNRYTARADWAGRRVPLYRELRLTRNGGVCRAMQDDAVHRNLGVRLATKGDRYFARVTSIFAFLVSPSIEMFMSPVIRSSANTRSNLTVRPSPSATSVILSPSILPLLMA